MSQNQSSIANFLGGTLLVAGTAIGGGMLALPILAGLGGFIPSVVLYLICWLFMASTGLLYLEACLWSNGETNILSLATRSLGPVGRIATWLVYLFFFYCLTLAYIVGCGDLLAEFSGNTISPTLGAWLYTAFTAPFVFIGWRAIAPINVALMVGLGLSYFAFIFIGYKHIEPQLLLRSDWSHMFVALPIAFAAFGYQGVVPSLVSYMGRNAGRIRLAIILGSLLPLLAYTIWNSLILGIVPLEGKDGLIAAAQQGKNAVFPLKNIVNSSSLYDIGQFFAFFALTTSLLGVTLGITDFLADGIRIKKDFKGRLLLSALVFLPPLAVGTYYPGLFLQALSVAGGIGSVILLGLLPILIVWAGRYNKQFFSSYRFLGGKLLLAILGIFAAIELLSELYNLI